MVSLAVTVWGRVGACPERSRRDPSGPSKARLRFYLRNATASVCLIRQKACRALLGLDGSETRPYTVCAGLYFTIGTLTCFFFAKSFASS